MAEVTSTRDLIDQAALYQEELLDELKASIIAKSKKAKYYFELTDAANSGPFEDEIFLERIRLVNTILADYITKEF
jgi:hypothetical protein